MRKRVQIRTAEGSNDATNVWINHLVNRIIIEQLHLPYRLQAKLLYETMPKTKEKK
ncbi:MAG: hypothetical protein ABF649_08005 [Bacillus sp. (in: firmicutes)]